MGTEGRTDNYRHYQLLPKNCAASKSKKKNQLSQSIT